MKTLKDLFTEHPATVGETYGQHLVSATGFSLRMIAAGIACLVHALLPFLFVTTGSNAIARLYDRMILNRARCKSIASQSSTVPASALQRRGADDPKVLPTH